MEFLAEERRTLESFLPGLDDQLAAAPLERLESRESPAVGMFRDAGGAGLLVPSEHRGLGAGPVEAIRTQRAIGSRSPSLAVATTMHHFSVASLVELWTVEKGLEWMLLQAVAEQHRLLASGFAEGVRGQGVLVPTMRGRRVDGNVLISGSKKPCSLARSMDLLTASVVIESEDPGIEDEFGVAIIPADAPGIEVSPFWGTSVLAGAESEEVALTDVPVDSQLVVTIERTDGGRLDAIQTAGFLWFELLITASYLGMASALLERALRERRGEASPRAAAACDLESAVASLEGVGHQMNDGDRSADLLTKALLCRYGAQDAINRAVASSVEQLGGMAFVRTEDVNYFAAASRALAFHPPGRLRTAEALTEALVGAELEIA
ncbi:MAG: acyl-CoA dehydrogenase [Actinomycetota bacterium]|nr:acyl-CoA dehydrogenase [Actinomycetota bacterium]